MWSASLNKTFPSFLPNHLIRTSKIATTHFTPSAILSTVYTGRLLTVVLVLDDVLVVLPPVAGQSERLVLTPGHSSRPRGHGTCPRGGRLVQFHLPVCRPPHGVSHLSDVALKHVPLNVRLDVKQLRLNRNFRRSDSCRQTIKVY